MKICGIIAEYNPLHLGHIKQIKYAKKELGAEKVVIILSGNFTERGEPAVLNKFLRAEHAIKGGADLVIELPTVLTVANAETFAFGAVSLLNSLGVADGLCFGVESGEKEQYISLAREMNNESKEFKKILKENLEKGYSLCKSKYETVKALGGEYDESLISSPNNILGLEYTKALLKLNSAIEIFPLKREVNHAEEKLRKGISSAGSIRKAIRAGKKRATKVALPKFVYKDLKGFPEELEKTTLAAAIIKDAEEIAEVPDCTEGLENRIKALLKDNKTLPELLNKVTTRRYTESRIRRILTCNLLGITRPLVVTALNKPLYAKVLATNKSGLELIAEIEKNGNVPLLTRKSDLSKLGKSALAVYDIDVIANELYSLSTGEKINENQMIIAER